MKRISQVAGQHWQAQLLFLDETLSKRRPTAERKVSRRLVKIEVRVYTKVKEGRVPTYRLKTTLGSLLGLATGGKEST